MGHRYFAREVYLAWLDKQQDKSGNIDYTSLRNSAFQMVRGRSFTETQSSSSLDGKLDDELMGKLNEWTDKKASGDFYHKQAADINAAVSTCLQDSTLSTECQNSIANLSVWRPNFLTMDLDQLELEMKTSLSSFLKYTGQGYQIPLYQEFAKNREEFKKELNALVGTNMLPEDISIELLKMGVYFDVVHNKIMYFNKRDKAGIPAPLLKP